MLYCTDQHLTPSKEFINRNATRRVVCPPTNCIKGKVLVSHNLTCVSQTDGCRPLITLEVNIRNECSVKLKNVSIKESYFRCNYNVALCEVTSDNIYIMPINKDTVPESFLLTGELLIPSQSCLDPGCEVNVSYTFMLLNEKKILDCITSKVEVSAKCMNVITSEVEIDLLGYKCKNRYKCVPNGDHDLNLCEEMNCNCQEPKKDPCGEKEEACGDDKLCGKICDDWESECSCDESESDSPCPGGIPIKTVKEKMVLTYGPENDGVIGNQCYMRKLGTCGKFKLYDWTEKTDGVYTGFRYSIEGNYKILYAYGVTGDNHQIRIKDKAIDTANNSLKGTFCVPIGREIDIRNLESKRLKYVIRHLVFCIAPICVRRPSPIRYKQKRTKSEITRNFGDKLCLDEILSKL